ncbi:hypothetical protein SRHO_G00248530 [Serrasalmus rhombeus]
MRVRRGDSITLYCDCVWKTGLSIVWFRNCSHEHQPPLIISTMDLIHSAETSKDLMFGAFPRYAPVWNQSSQTHDLLVKNVTESDLGLYYCALQEKKITNNEKGMHYGDIYHYGNRTTRLCLLDLTAQDLLQTTPTSPESDRGICWKLLVIFCPVCALISSVLSSTCVYCICSKKTKVAVQSYIKEGEITLVISYTERLKVNQRETVKRQQDRRNAQVEGGDVCYASLDIQSTGQRHVKTRRVESSDFSTYSEIKRNVPLTWTNKISTNTDIRLKHPQHLQPPSTSLCNGEIKIHTYHCHMTSGAKVEMRVRPGDDVTLYSDCVWKSGFNTVWFRNSSKEHPPPLIVSTEDFMRGARPCYSFVWNPSSDTHDLLVKNVSESDLGLYYCAVHEKKITEDETGVIVSEDVYHYGSRITRLSLLAQFQTDQGESNKRQTQRNKMRLEEVIFVMLRWISQPEDRNV